MIMLVNIYIFNLNYPFTTGENTTGVAVVHQYVQ